MNNKIEQKNNYDQYERINSGLLAVFPSIDAYDDFIDDNNGVIENFIHLAVENHIIANEDSFKSYIEKNSINPTQVKEIDEATFSEILQEQTDTPTKLIIDEINKLIKKYKLDYMVPSGKVSYSMLSRLQREPPNTITKRNSIRLISFGYCYLRPDLHPLWNYERLVRSCPNELKTEYTQGVRVTFDIYDREDIIEAKTIKGLKSDILEYSDSTIPIQYKKVTPYSSSCFYIDFPKENMTQSNINLPKSYERSLRQSFDLVHKITIKWALLKLRYPNRILTIGITAGEFSELDTCAQYITKTKHPFRSRIVLSDFTRVCVIASGILISFKEKHELIEKPHGKSIISWEIKNLLENNPYQLVPYFFDDDFLEIFEKNDLEETPDLDSRMKNIKTIFNGNGFDKIFPHLKYPEDPFIGLEIAKVLYLKGRVRAANDILNFLLLVDPTNLAAKINRMNIYWNSGFRSKFFSVSNIHFLHAEKEASEIDHSNISFSDEFFCQYAVSKIGQAISVLSLLRKGGGIYKENEIIFTTNDVFTPLDNLIQKSEKQLYIQPDKSQSLFLVFYAMGLKYLLSRNEEITTNDSIDIINKNNIYHNISEDYFESIDNFTNKNSLDMQSSNLTKNILDRYKTQNDFIILDSVIPNNIYFQAAMIWDFSPTIDMDVINIVSSLLKNAMASAQKLKEKRFYAISWLRARNELVPADSYVEQIKVVINKIESIKKSKEANINGENTERLVLFFNNI